MATSTVDVIDREDDSTHTCGDESGCPESMRVDWLQNADDDESRVGCSRSHRLGGHGR